MDRIFIICYFWSDLIHEAETWLVVNVLLASFLLYASFTHPDYGTLKIPSMNPSFQQECKGIVLTTHSSGADMTGDRGLPSQRETAEIIDNSMSPGSMTPLFLLTHPHTPQGWSVASGDRGLEAKFWLPYCLAARAGHLSLCFSPHRGFCEDEVGLSIALELERDCSVSHHSVSVGKVSGSIVHKA